MRNVIVLGSGRSGTSMVTGTLAKSGYFMGDYLWQAREANPKGFFEDREINSINEDILEPIIPKRLKIRGIARLGIPQRFFFRHHPIKSQMWLANIPLRAKIRTSEEIVQRIKKIVERKPYCLKDPRFSYTLPIWKPYFENTVYVCVFRDPASTATSILKECSSVPHLSHHKTGIKLSWWQTLKIWHKMYHHILEKHYCNDSQWLFLHYDQAVSEEGLDKLAAFTEADIDKSFPDSQIRRSFSSKSVPKSIWEIYQRLCSLAGYQDNSLIHS